MEIASAFVTIRPETSGFSAELSAALGGETVEVPVGADVTEAESEISSVDGGTTDVEVGATTDEAQSAIDAIDGGTATVDVSADTSQAQASIEGLGGTVDAAVGALTDLGGDGGAAGLASGGLAGFTSAALEALGVSAALATGVGAMGVAVGMSVDSAMDAQVVQAKLAQVLSTTGANAYVSQDALNALSTEVMNYSGQSDEAIGSAQTLLLTFQGVSNEAAVNAGVLDRATRATADIAALMGGDASGAAIRLGRALDNPVAGMTALQRSGVSFTESQKATIAALYESGDVIGAQTELLNVVESQVGGVAEAYGDTLAGQLDIAGQKFDNIKEEVGNSFLPAIQATVGPALDLADAIASIGDALGLFTGPLSMMNESMEQGGIEGWTAQLLAAGPATLDWSSANDDAAKSFGPINEAIVDAVRGLDALNASTGDYIAALFGVPNAQRDLRQSFAELTAAMAEGTWDDQAMAMQGVVASTAAMIATQREHGATTRELDATIYGSIATLAQMRDAGQITGAQFDELSQQIRDVPHQATTEVSAPGIDGTLRALQQVRTTIDGIPRSVVVQVSVPSLGAIAADVAGAARALRSLSDVESTPVVSRFGAAVGRPTTVSTAPTGPSVARIYLDRREIAEAVFDADRQMAIAEGYEQ